MTAGVAPISLGPGRADQGQGNVALRCLRKPAIERAEHPDKASAARLWRIEFWPQLQIFGQICQAAQAAQAFFKQRTSEDSVSQEADTIGEEFSGYGELERPCAIAEENMKYFAGAEDRHAAA
jgi:hypothetical protein